MSQAFTFALDSFNIATTRSLYHDTDFLSFTLVVNPQGGQGTPQTLVRSMGNIGNGTHAVNLSFPNVVVNPTDTVVVNYLIFNSALQEPSVNAARVLIEQTLESVGASLSTLTAVDKPPTGSVPIPHLSSALGVLDGWLFGQFYSVLQADNGCYNFLCLDGCDGPVAAEQDVFTYQDLIGATSVRPFNQNTAHAGLESGNGCGANSKYTVSWHIANPASVNRSVPKVIGDPVKTAESAITLAGLTWALARGSKTGTVINQSPPAMTPVNAGAQVTITLDNNR